MAGIPWNTPSGYGPVGGEYYDDAASNEQLDVTVFWNGKAVEREYRNKTGLTKVVFTDGSWADLFHRTCGNTGPGDLALGDYEGNLIAR
jgi:hypothetical protein